MPKIPFSRQKQLAKYWILKGIREGRVPETIDVEAILDHLDPSLEYEENMRILYELIGYGPPWVMETYGGRRSWELLQEREVAEATKRLLWEENAERFLDLYPDKEDVAGLIRNGEIPLDTAILVYSKYGDELFYECEFDPRCIVSQFVMKEREKMEARTKWRIIVQELKQYLSKEDQELLLDPYLPEEIKIGLLEELGLKKYVEDILAGKYPRGRPKLVKHKPELKPPEKPIPIRAPEEKKAPIRNIEDALKRALERMGYSVIRIERYYRIAPNIFSVMFVDRYGKRHYIYRVEI